MFDVPLSEKEKANPHKTVQDRGQSLSVLERSFRNHRLAHIQEWDDLGVLAQAMSGAVPRSRRKYTRTLMDFFLSRSVDWTPSIERAGAREKVLSRLWAMGAKQHAECWDAWLHGALADRFADRLLDVGANPHAPVRVRGFPTSATGALMEGVVVAASSYRKQEGAVALPVLRDRLLRCLDTPGASQGQLDGYLASATRHAVHGPSTLSSFWLDVMRRLLGMGARVGFGNEDALAALASPPQPRVDWVAHASRASEEARRLGRELSVEERDALGQRWLWRERLASGRGAHRALDLLLQYPTAWPPSTVAPPEHFWGRLLDAVGGVQTARRLLAAGIAAPWQGPPGIEGAKAMPGAPRLLADGYERSPRRLARFARLAPPQSIAPGWARAMRRQYLASRRSPAPPSPRGHGSMALTEVALLFDALPWCGELPEEVQDWICGLPNEWAQRQVSLDERAAVFGFLQGRGWLQAMLAPSPSEVIATRFSSFARSFAERWSACPDSEALVAACPGLEKAWTTLLGVVHQKHAVREVAVSRVCAAVLRSPEDADAFLAHAQGALAHDAHWSSMRTVLRTVAALRQAGWNSGDPEFEQNLAWSGVCMAHGWGEAHQVAFVDSMKLAGFDFSANGCLGLTRLVDQEATLSNPLGMAQLLPLATALIDRGVDLRGMPQVEDPDRPLGCVVRVAREYQQMQDRAQAAVAGPRRCRL